MPNIEYWINHIHHNTTGYTPQQIISGEEPKLPWNLPIQFSEEYAQTDQTHIYEIVRKRTKAKACSKTKQKDQKKIFTQYREGQQVLVRDHRFSNSENHEIAKFFLLYKGPYKITN
jgi:hypothetical protein